MTFGFVRKIRNVVGKITPKSVPFKTNNILDMVINKDQDVAIRRDKDYHCLTDNIKGIYDSVEGIMLKPDKNNILTTNKLNSVYYYSWSGKEYKIILKGNFLGAEGKLNNKVVSIVVNYNSTANQTTIVFPDTKLANFDNKLIILVTINGRVAFYKDEYISNYESIKGEQGYISNKPFIPLPIIAERWTSQFYRIYIKGDHRNLKGLIDIKDENVTTELFNGDSGLSEGIITCFTFNLSNSFTTNPYVNISLINGSEYIFDRKVNIPDFNENRKGHPSVIFNKPDMNQYVTLTEFNEVMDRLEALEAKG